MCFHHRMQLKQNISFKKFWKCLLILLFCTCPMLADTCFISKYVCVKEVIGTL